MTDWDNKQAGVCHRRSTVDAASYRRLHVRIVKYHLTKSWRAVMGPHAVSVFITAAFLVFGLILARTSEGCGAEHSREQLALALDQDGGRSMAISLLPLCHVIVSSR